MERLIIGILLGVSVVILGGGGLLLVIIREWMATRRTRGVAHRR